MDALEGSASSMTPEERRRARRVLLRRPSRGGGKALTRELFRRYHEEGDEQAREQIIESHMNLARHIAYKYRTSNESMEDLVQVAMLGLIEAVDRYDPSMQTEFTTYAYGRIVGVIKHYFRDETWMVRPPRSQQELSAKVRKARDDLTSELNRSPTVPEIAERVGASVDAVLESMVASKAYTAVPLDRSPQDAEDDAPTVLDRLSYEDGDLSAADDRIVFEQVLDNLSGRELDVFRMRFIEGMKQVDIAERLGISQVQVSRLLRRMVAKARETYEGGKDPAQ